MQRLREIFVTVSREKRFARNLSCQIAVFVLAFIESAFLANTTRV